MFENVGRAAGSRTQHASITGLKSFVSFDTGSGGRLFSSVAMNMSPGEVGETFAIKKSYRGRDSVQSHHQYLAMAENHG